MSKHGLPYTIVRKREIYYYRFPGGPYVSTGSRNPAEARRIAKEAWESSGGGTASTDTLGKALEPYYGPSCPLVDRRRMENKSIGDRHIKQSRRLLEKHILPDPITKKRLCDLRRDDVLQFRQRMNEALKPRAAQLTFTTLKACLGNLFFRELITRNPAQGVGVVNITSSPRGFFTREELTKLFEETPGVWRDLPTYTLFYLAAVSGMRRGELLALHWEDLDGPIIHVQRAFKDEAQTKEGLPKWNKPRSVAVPQRAVALLAEIRSRDYWTGPGDYIFAYPTGEPFGSGLWQNAFLRALEKAGIPKGTRTAHSFRHSVATQMNGKGVPMAIIQAMLGWVDQKMLNNYSHVQGSQALPFVDNLEI